MFARRWRRFVAVFAAAAVLTAGLVVATPTQDADAAAISGFRPGNIISDAVFFNNSTMSVQQIQEFLDSKVPTCRTGYVCLKDYKVDSWTRPADPMCGAYDGAVQETAATIIWRVGQACGINPQVLLVLLQKEQSLVQDTWPTARQYRSATGYGCPDTAACDEQFYGFYNQVFRAAWAFKRYSMPPGTGPGTEWNTVYSQYRPGATANVLYNPSYSCGSAPVFIENQATASLYFYTPYQPNAAALAAGYGRGDACSAYGNRNFYLYFEDWFGTARFPVLGALRDYYLAAGGRFGWLGEPTGVETAANGGWSQVFEGGSLHVQPGQAVIAVRAQLAKEYGRVGYQSGQLGWPVGAEKAAVNGGTVQEFQAGAIYNDGVGAFAEYGPMGAYYRSLGAFRSALGWPVGRMVAGADGSVTQGFQGGTVKVGADGAVLTPAKLEQRSGTSFVDVNGDGLTDMFGRRADGVLVFYGGTAGGALTAGKAVGSGWNMHSWIGSLGDGNADGIPDLWGREARTGALWFYPLDRNGVAQGRTSVGTGWNILDAIVGVGDVTQDGVPDLYGREVGSGALYVYVGDGTGGFTSRTRVNEGWDTLNAIVPVGDVSGDGMADLIGRSITNGDLLLYTTGANGAILSGERINLGWAGFDILLGGALPGTSSRGLIARDPVRGGGTLRRYEVTGTTVAPGVDFNVGWNVFGTLF